MVRAPVKSAVRALEILALFSHERRAMTQGEILQKLRYPQSSATFLLKSLMQSGYLSYDRRDRTYMPTPEVLHLGSWLYDIGYDHFFRKSVVTDLLHELQDATGETVCATTQNDIFAQFHRVMVKNLAAGHHIAEGTLLPLTYSAYGYALLSALPVKKIDRICRLINVRDHAAGRPLDRTVLAADLAQIRRVGYCYRRNPHLRGVGAVAMLLPVTIAGHSVAVGIGGLAERIERDLDRMIETLRASVARYTPDLKAAFPSDPKIAKSEAR